MLAKTASSALVAAALVSLAGCAPSGSDRGEQENALGLLYAVDPLTQRHLTFRGSVTAYGCTPTATSEVLEYWRKQGYIDGTAQIDAQSLLDEHAAQFQPNGGMSISDLSGDVQNLGLAFDVTVLSASDDARAALMTALARGPVLVDVRLDDARYELSAQGRYNHVVVVAGGDETGVSVVDSWVPFSATSGKQTFYGWPGFLPVWFNQTDATHTIRWLVSIHPPETAAAPDLSPSPSDPGALPDLGPGSADLMSPPPPTFQCGAGDGECTSSNYMASCSSGTCFGAGCCCPTEQRCAAGSFPVCCPVGQHCVDAANGSCSL